MSIVSSPHAARYEPAYSFRGVSDAASVMARWSRPFLPDTRLLIYYGADYGATADNIATIIGNFTSKRG